MEKLMIITLLVCIGLGLFGAESAKTEEEKEEQFLQRSDLLAEYVNLLETILKNAKVNSETKKIDGMAIQKLSKDKEVIATIFERYSAFKTQVSFLTGRAYYKLAVDAEKQKDTMDVYQGCLEYSKAMRLYNNEFLVRTFYDIEPKIKGLKDASYNIETTVKNIEILFEKLKKMEDVFEETEKNGYENLFAKLSEVGAFTTDKVEKIDLDLDEPVNVKKKQFGKEQTSKSVEEDKNVGKKGTRALLQERFLKFFGETVLAVENYWLGFYGQTELVTDHSALVGDEATMDLIFRLTEDVTRRTFFDSKVFDKSTIFSMVVAEIAYLSRTFGDVEHYDRNSKRQWDVIVPKEGRMDFLYSLTNKKTEPESRRNIQGLQPDSAQARLKGLNMSEESDEDEEDMDEEEDEDEKRDVNVKVLESKAT